MFDLDVEKIKHRIWLKVTDEEGRIVCTPMNYVKKLLELFNVCVEGGGAVADVKDVEFTYEDKDDPFVLFTVEAFERVKSKIIDRTTTFLIRKVDMYKVGYILSSNIKEKKWLLTSDVVAEINMINPRNGSKSCGFPSSYSPRADIDYRLGPTMIVTSLGWMRDENLNHLGFIGMCHHVSEPTRFPDLADFIVPLFKMKNFEYRTREMTAGLKSLLNKWKKLSQDLINKDYSEVFKGGNKLGECLIRCGKMENPKSKTLRMKKAIEKHGALLKDHVGNKPIRELNAHERLIKGLDDPHIIGHVSLKLINVKGKKLNDDEVKSILKQWINTKGGNFAIWVALKNAMVHPDKKMAESIINNSSIFVIGNDLSKCIDLDGHVYDPPMEDITRMRSGR